MNFQHSSANMPQTYAGKGDHLRSCGDIDLQMKNINQIRKFVKILFAQSLSVFSKRFKTSGQNEFLQRIVFGNAQ